MLKICFLRYNKSGGGPPGPHFISAFRPKHGWMENLKSTRTALSRKHTHTMHTRYAYVCVSKWSLPPKGFGGPKWSPVLCSTCQDWIWYEFFFLQVFLFHSVGFVHFALPLFFLAILLIKQNVASGSQWRCHCLQQKRKRRKTVRKIYLYIVWGTRAVRCANRLHDLLHCLSFWFFMIIILLHFV